MTYVPARSANELTLILEAKEADILACEQSIAELTKERDDYRARAERLEAAARLAIIALDQSGQRLIEASVLDHPREEKYVGRVKENSPVIKALFAALSPTAPKEPGNG